ncbi:MAG: hypothetical protein DWI28_00115 [Planctomycetota bacterium]|nr:MAG: hypothetical protein DWI28_00115 [Planctomycetota bacterium]
MTRSKWTQQIVIERIQFLHQQGIPVGKIHCADKRLCLVSYSLFESWRAALEAAGLKSERQVWTPERVLMKLKDQHQQGITNRRRQKRDSSLVSAAVRYFGSRRAALIAAGIINRPQLPKKIWTPSAVIEAIIARHEQNLPLVNMLRHDKSLFCASAEVFGGWHKAKVAAGLAHDRRKALAVDEIIQNLQSRHQQGNSLKFISRDEADFYASIKVRFGSLHSALVAAGLPTPVRKRWTKRSLIQALNVRSEKGPPLSHVWKDDTPLFRAAVNHYGNWNAALRAAGVQFKTYQKWSNERILSIIRESYHGQSFKDIDPNLIAAANKYFGGFYKAVEAAGLDLPHGKWSKRRIIDMIQEYYINGRRLEINGFGEKRFAENAKRYFGTWREAVKAAGLESRLPAPITTRTWSPDEVLKAIRSIAESDGNLSRAWRDTGLYSVAKKHFGTWRQAVRAAGCEPARRRWSMELIIHEIQERYRKNLPLTSIVFTQDPPLAGAATRLFGNWKAAVAAAGILQSQPSQTKATGKR